MRPTVDERFDAKWIPEPNTGCFLWFAARDKDGYGIFWDGEKDAKAHRHALEKTGVHIPANKLVCHRCDTPECVNPEHLWIGTAGDNNQDAARKGRSASGNRNASRARPETRPRGTSHYMAKLSANDVLEIRRRFDAGEAHNSIARDFGIGRNNVSEIGRRKTWRHL